MDDDERTREDIECLNEMFAGTGADLSKSVIGTVLMAHEGKVDQAIDTLLNMTADPLNDEQVLPPAAVEQIETLVSSRYGDAPQEWRATQSALLKHEAVLRLAEQQLCSPNPVRPALRHEEDQGGEDATAPDQQRKAMLFFQEEKEKRRQRERELARREIARRQQELQQRKTRELQLLRDLQAVQPAGDDGKGEKEDDGKGEKEEQSSPQRGSTRRKDKKRNKRSKRRDAELERKIRAELERELKDEADAKIEEEVQRVKEEMQRHHNHDSPIAPGLSVYTRSAQGDLAAQISAVMDVLKEGGAGDAIKLLDVSNDYELAGFLKEKFSSSPDDVVYPLVFVHDTPLTLQQLQQLRQEGTLERVLQGDTSLVPARKSTVAAAPPSQQEQTAEETAQDETNKDAGPAKAPAEGGSGVYYGQGVLDRCLDAAEYVSSGVSSVLWLPVTLITWPFRSGEQPLPEGVDFDVVHTNWYWRNLRRRFRFMDNEFVRLHPTHMDVRAAHKYNDVQTITFMSKTNIVIKYRDNSSPDYITAVAPDCENMAKLITSRATESVGILRLEEEEEDKIVV